MFIWQQHSVCFVLYLYAGIICNILLLLFFFVPRETECHKIKKRRHISRCVWTVKITLEQFNVF